MRYHHTKNKGDLGVLNAAADLARKGWDVLWPMTEHAAYDLVANRGAVFIKVQVKYRTMKRGSLFVDFRSAWADRHGVHLVPIDKDAIDLICIYCPDTESCYYVDPKTCPSSVCLRVLEPANNQRKNVRRAVDYKKLPWKYWTEDEKKNRHARQGSNLRAGN